MLTVIFDLVVAIEVGMVLACLLFIKRMSEETKVNGWTYVDEDTPDVDEHLQKLPLQIRVYEISGPLFFGAASVIEEIVVKDFILDTPRWDQNWVKVMEKAGFIELVGEENFQPSISAALDRAEEIIHK